MSTCPRVQVRVLWLWNTRVRVHYEYQKFSTRVLRVRVLSTSTPALLGPLTWHDSKQSELISELLPELLIVAQNMTHLCGSRPGGCLGEAQLSRVPVTYGHEYLSHLGKLLTSTYQAWRSFYQFYPAYINWLIIYILIDTISDIMQYDKLGLDMLFIFPGAALLTWHLLQSAWKSVFDIKKLYILVYFIG